MSDLKEYKLSNRLYEPVLQMAMQYHQATGVSVRVLDSDVREIYRVDDPSWGCQFCQSMRKEESLVVPIVPKTHCNSTHVFSAVRSRQLNGHYVYQCRSGFTFWSSSIVINGKFLASVVAGSTILQGRSDFMKNVGHYHHKQNIDTRSLDLLTHVQNASEERVIALAEILNLSCVALSQRHSHGNLKNISINNSAMSVFNADFMLYEELVLLVESASYEEAKVLASKIYEEIKGSMNNDFLSTKEQVLDLAIFLTNVTNAQGSGDFSLNLQFVRDLQAVSTHEALEPWLLRVIEMVSCIPSRVKELKYGHLLVQAVRYMHLNFVKNITLEEVASIAKLSSSYFSRLFKAEMGVSFTEYLNQIRINESKRKLKFTSLALSEVATACGFSDQSYFTKIFKRSENLSPGRYRQGNK
jgi:two-component system, response regulator YesN